MKYIPLSLHKGFLSALVLSIAFTTPVTSFAQDVLEEIIVTATKREESLQDAPISVSAFSGEQLDRAGVADTMGLSNLVPNVTIGTEGARDAVYISIRGISQNERRNTDDATTPLNVDGATVPRMSGVNAYFYDVERIETLRGPQGTLYGKNSTSGVVNVITRKPDMGSVGGDIEVSYGNYNAITSKGAINVPLADNIAARAAFIYNNRDGYRNNGPLVEDGDDADDYGIRGHLLWDIRDDTSLLLSADHYNREGVGAVLAAVDCSSLGCGPTVASTSPDPADTNPLNTQGFRNNEDTNFKLELNHSFEAFDITYLASWREHSRDYNNDNDGSASSIDYTAFGAGPAVLDARVRETTESDSFSTELRATSTGDNALDWIAGFYYLDEEINGQFQFIPPFYHSMGHLNVQFNDIGLTYKSYAVFGNLAFHLNDTFTLNAGLRYTSDEKDKGGINDPANPSAGSFQIVSIFETGMALGPFPRAQVANPEWDEVTWSIGLDWHINDDSFAYFKASTGYKAGGFNRGSNEGSGFPNVAILNIYDPEKVNSYELGWKADVLDGRGRINASVFYNDYKNKVESVVSVIGGTPTNTAVNAADAEIYGLEVESSWLYGDQGGRVDVNLGWLDASYGVFDNLPNPFTGGSIDVSGGDLVNAPDWNLNITWIPMELDFMNGILTPRLQMSYKSSYITRPHGTPIDVQDDYSRTNASVYWASNENGLYAEAFVNNIEDEAIQTYSSCGNSVIGSMAAPAPNGQVCQKIFQPPRTFGFRIGYKFD